MKMFLTLVLFLGATHAFAADWKTSDVAIRASVLDSSVPAGRVAFDMDAVGSVQASDAGPILGKMTSGGQTYDCKNASLLYDMRMHLDRYYCFIDFGDFVSILDAHAKRGAGYDSALAVFKNYYALRTDKRVVIFIGHNSPSAGTVPDETEFVDPQSPSVKIEMTSLAAGLQL